MQTDALIEGMNALGYRVANLSLRELSHGYDVFLQRQKKARFEFVSANVVWQDTGEPIVPPTTVVRAALRDGAKVALNPGEDAKTVHFIAFDPGRQHLNDFTATNQYRVQGVRQCREDTALWSTASHSSSPNTKAMLPVAKIGARLCISSIATSGKRR